MKFTKAASLILSLAMAMSMAGCAESSTAQNDTASAADIQPISESAQWQFPDDPKDYTVDDYRHMVSVNGITITLPTTINELKKLDEKFGYEVDYVYDGVNQVLPDGSTGYDMYITYDGKKVCLTSFKSEPDEKFIPDAEIFFAFFGNDYTDETVDFRLFNEIKLGSEILDIKKKMGEPTTLLREVTEEYKYTFESYNVNIMLGYIEQKKLGGAIISIRENSEND